MKSAAACLLALAGACSMPVHAQEFVNLDFDQATLPQPLPPGPQVFAWSDALPGWNHSAGDSTEHVYLQVGHIGFSQWYAILDTTFSPFGSASDAYAAGLHSGTFREQEPRGDFTTAFLSQTGRVPVGAQTLSLLANTPQFGIALNGTSIAMQADGPDRWIGDISAFAGQVVELRITDGVVDPMSTFLVVDEIRFLPVPEPSTFALTALGVLVLCALARRR